MNQNQIQLSQELNILGNQLTTNINELLEEVKTYIQHYDDRTFISPQIDKNTNQHQIKKEISKGETIFDRVNESLLRNEIVNKLEQIVEEKIHQFCEKMKSFKERIINERKTLIESNNEILQNLEKLHLKCENRKIKSSHDEELKLSLKVSSPKILFLPTIKNHRIII